MAKRTPRSRTYKTGLISRVIPESAQAFLARRIIDGAGIAMTCFGAFAALALLTYSAADPSMNSASSAETIHNMMGGAGAWFSDLTLQSFGIAAFLFSFASILWGVRMVKRKELPPLWLRISVLCCSLLLFSLAFSILPALFWRSTLVTMGGSVGIVLLNGLSAVTRHILPFSPHFLIALAALAMGLFILPLALGFRLRNGVTIFALIREAAFTTLHKSIELYAAFSDWLHHYGQKEAKEPELPLKQPKRERKAPVIEAPELSVQQPVASVLKDIKVVTPQPASAAPLEKPKQSKLALADSTDWILPPSELLQEPPEQDSTALIDRDVLRKNAEDLQNVLSDFNVQGEITSIHPGPVVTLYELEPAPGTKTARVISLCDDIARQMSAVSVRAAVVPGRSVIGIELPNKKRQTVYMREMLGTRLVEKSGAKLPLLLGKDIGGQPVVADLARMPHLLVAGTTGSGKSVAINTMLLSLLYHLPPEKCRLIMIDPKMLELSVYDDIPHLLSPVVTEPGKAVVALKWTVREMEDRYRAMSKLGVRNIEGYNIRLAEARKKGEVLMRKVQTGFEPTTGKPVYEEQPLDLTEMPYIVVVVDEFADLMLVAGKDVENAIQRLAQMARAAGIHIIMATQRPSVDVITGVIKANFPTRISFAVTSKIDSRTILGEGGAEQLLGMGDMLYMSPGGRIQRVHGPFVSDNDVVSVVNFLKQQGDPNYIEDVTAEANFGDSDVMAAMFGDGEGGGNGDDELYNQAVALVAREQKASTSFIQRHLQIGYNRAARIIEEMERQGVVTASQPDRQAGGTGRGDMISPVILTQ